MNAQARVYFATEFANIPETKRVLKRTIIKNKKEEEVEYDDYDTAPGYRAVIWRGNGRGALWSDERPKAFLPTDPEVAFQSAREAAEKLGVPVDLYRYGNEFVETVGV